LTDKVEEIKQVTKEFYILQQRLTDLMLELTDEEHKEFHPWFQSVTAETFKH
jgi:hypothetical protein